MVSVMVSNDDCNLSCYIVGVSKSIRLEALLHDTLPILNVSMFWHLSVYAGLPWLGLGVGHNPSLCLCE